MNAENFAGATVADIVISDYRTAEIFEKYGIDFCCRGKRSLEQACEEKQLNRQEIENEIQLLNSEAGRHERNYKDWPLSFLIDYIVNIHHSYIKNSVDVIAEWGAKVVRSHGQQFPESVEIHHLWQTLSLELEHHLKKEELVLFPYIKNLEKFRQGELKQLPGTQFVNVKSPVRLMEQEHETAGNLMLEIQEFSDGFTPPAEACDTFRVWYARLKEFRDDLHQHIHLENNLLFPKTILLEGKLKRYN